MSETPPITLGYLTIPDHPTLHAALGRLAIAHTHLELMLRYCVKVIADQKVEEAFDATEGERISDLRVRVKGLFKERRPTELEKNDLDALLGRARRLSEMRNAYLHSAYDEYGEAIDSAGGKSSSLQGLRH